MTVPYSRVAAAFFGGILAFVMTNLSASATDAELQNALQKSGCRTPSIKQLFQRGDTSVFEANCSQSSHRVITVTCTKQVCRVEEPSRENEPGER